jgi:hypothetical protein
MRYVFAKEGVEIEVTLPPGALLLVFPPDEQQLAHTVVCGIIGLMGRSEELTRIAQLLRTEHDKQEEN